MDIIDFSSEKISNNHNFDKGGASILAISDEKSIISI